MHAPTTTFPERVSIAILDKRLQAALDHASGGFVQKRAALVAALPEFEALRERARSVKEHVLAHLDTYLERYEEQVKRQGGQVHWASSAEEAREIILEICRKANARTITKGKSMVSEEIGLNDALEAAGYHVVETDLGEYIIQLAKEPPSHIIVPAVHKTRAQVADLFDEFHRPLGYTKHLTEVSEMVNEARQVLREHYFKADVGITGGNFLIAETGSSIIVTNEGNGDLTQTLARVHIVTSGIERVVPTLDDASTFLRLLARSATGQETETYTTVSTGPRRADDLDGPQEYHVVLVDNGRSKMLGGPFREMLRCIRCGACLNHCPVYTSIGGHAYGWVYPGPMGSVLTPLINGIDSAYDLPNACTLERPLPDRVPGEDPAARAAARTAAPAVRDRPHAGADPLGAAGLGGAGQTRRAVPPGDAHRHPAAQPHRPAPRRTRLAAAGRWLDRHARPAGAAGRHLPAGLARAPGSAPMSGSRERCWRRSAGRSGAARRAPTPSRPCPAAGRGRPSKATRSNASWPRCWRSRPRWCASPRSTRSAPRSSASWPRSAPRRGCACRRRSTASPGRPRLQVEYRAAVREDQTSVTPCFAAVAESGGIVTLSGPDTPSTLNFVPDNHIVIVRAAQVLRALRGCLGVMARHRPAVAAHPEHHLGSVAYGRHRADHPARRARAAPAAHPADGASSSGWASRRWRHRA